MWCLSHRDGTLPFWWISWDLDPPKFNPSCAPWVVTGSIWFTDLLIFDLLLMRAPLLTIVSSAKWGECHRHSQAFLGYAGMVHYQWTAVQCPFSHCDHPSLGFCLCCFQSCRVCFYCSNCLCHGLTLNPHEVQMENWFWGVMSGHLFRDLCGKLSSGI